MSKQCLVSNQHEMEIRIIQASKNDAYHDQSRTHNVNDISNVHFME